MLATRKRLRLVLLLIVSVTVLSWSLGTGGGGHPTQPNLTISATVIFIALFKVRVIMREFMEVGLAPTWVRRTSDGWLVLFFAAVFAAHYAAQAWGPQA